MLIEPNTVQNRAPLVEEYRATRKVKQEHSELSRLLAAAVVSRQFCNMLLTDPAAAIQNGFAGEHFSLSADEYEIVLSARGSTLPELAQRFCRFFPIPKPITTIALSEDLQSTALLRI